MQWRILSVIQCNGGELDMEPTEGFWAHQA